MTLLTFGILQSICVGWVYGKNIQTLFLFLRHSLIFREKTWCVLNFGASCWEGLSTAQKFTYSIMVFLKTTFCKMKCWKSILNMTIICSISVLYIRCRSSIWWHRGYDWIPALAVHEVLLEISNTSYMHSEYHLDVLHSFLLQTIWESMVMSLMDVYIVFIPVRRPQSNLRFRKFYSICHLLVCIWHLSLVSVFKLTALKKTTLLSYKT